MMQSHRNRFLEIAGVALVVLTTAGGTAMAIETAEYTVSEKHEGFEIREYQPQILVETTVAADFEGAGNEAFRRLFRYISGENRAQAKIAMTAPVSQQPSSTKIAMTAPVVTEGSGDDWRIAFLLPSSFTWDTAPEPIDAEVQLRRVSSRTMAALRFSGRWSEERFREHESMLRTQLAERGIEVAGDAIYARYDPPFKPWFLRRNEILIPVAPIR